MKNNPQLKAAASFTAIMILSIVFQTSLMWRFSLGGVTPDLVMILICSIGLLSNEKQGLFAGFFTGLFMDMIFGICLGMYAAIYMCLGFFCGIMRKRINPDDFALPMVIIAGCDLVQNMILFGIRALSAGELHLSYYLKSVIIPQFVYTMLVSVFVYILLGRYVEWIMISSDRRENRKGVNGFDL